jgi:hypothetical protein
MPLDETIKYSPRDLRTFKRIETVNNSSNVLMYFLKRFQNFDALKAIVLHFILRLMKASLNFGTSSS